MALKIRGCLFEGVADGFRSGVPCSGAYWGCLDGFTLV